MTYPKRTTDLEVGDVVHMYGTRERVAEVQYSYPDRRYTAVMTRMEVLRPDGSVAHSHNVCYDNKFVSVELPAGMKLVAVPVNDAA